MKVGGAAITLGVWKVLEIVVDVAVVERAASGTSGTRGPVATLGLVEPESFVRVAG